MNKTIIAFLLIMILVSGCMKTIQAKLTSSLEDDKQACIRRVKPMLPTRVTCFYHKQWKVWQLRKMVWGDGRMIAANVDFRPAEGPDQVAGLYYAYRPYTGNDEAGYKVLEANKEVLASMKFKLKPIPNTLTDNGEQMDFQIIDPEFTWCDWEENGEPVT
ncbi:hypothetical protein ACFLRF_03830 [Candidatus Altiarchaeota archaeon]